MIKLVWAWWCHQMETFSALLAICVGNSPHKGQSRVALMFSLICVWINGWINNREAGDLRRYRAHHDVTVWDLYPSNNPVKFQTDLKKKWVIEQTSLVIRMVRRKHSQRDGLTDRKRAKDTTPRKKIVRGRVIVLIRQKIRGPLFLT